MVTDFNPEQFQSRVYASYEAIHSALESLPLDFQAFAQPSNADEPKGALAGQFLVSDSLQGESETLPLAALIAGACFLGMDPNVEVARDMLRHGRCDFVVNSLDEALRILKNELRQKKPVAVCLSGDVPLFIQEMADRGVAPQLLLHVLPVAEYPAFARLRETGTKLCEAASLAHLQGRAGNADGELTRWELPKGTSTMLARLDAVAREVIPASNRKRRRWLEAASRYLPRATPPARIASLTSAELERFVDGISARLMSGDVAGPVSLTVDGQTMVLGNEAVA